MHLGLAVAVGYLLGSIPSAYLIGRIRGFDVRREGSGNVGAANVGRLAGVWFGVIVFALDVGKALVVFAFVGDDPVTLVAASWAVIVGHQYPVWLGFTGGRGEAVSLATGFVVAPMPMVALSPVLVVGWFTKNLALSWLLAVTVLPIVAWFVAGPTEAVFAFGVAVLTYVRRLIGSPGIGDASFGQAWWGRLLYDREPEST